MEFITSQYIKNVLVPQFPQHFHNLGSSSFTPLGKVLKLLWKGQLLSKGTVRLPIAHWTSIGAINTTWYCWKEIVFTNPLWSWQSRRPDRFHPTTPLSISELHPLPWYISSFDHQGIYIFKKDNNLKICTLPLTTKGLKFWPHLFFIQKALYGTFLFRVQVEANEPYWHTKIVEEGWERLKENMKFRKVEDILAWKNSFEFLRTCHHVLRGLDHEHTHASQVDL